PLFFVSASPSQLRPVIERKMALDGIGFDGTTFKDWAGVLRRGRVRRFREQLGFKMTALMAGRASLPEGAEEVLLGDDLETDPVTYALYADSLAGRIPTSDLPRILRLNGVLPSDANAIARARRDLLPGRGVLRAFIRRERHTDPDAFLEFAPGVVGCLGAFQMAAALWRLESVSWAGVIRVADDLVRRGVDRAVMRDRLRDLCRRAILTRDETVELGRELFRRSLAAELGDPGEPDPAWARAWE